MEPGGNNLNTSADGKEAPNSLNPSPTPSPASVAPVGLGKAPQPRFAFVDGLRGLSALSIVVFHIWKYEPEPYPSKEHTHWLLEEAFWRTRGAVQVLLVISGFVIAYTLRKTWVTPSEVLSFLARRIVRLAPAYWVTIAAVILVDAVCRLYGDLPSPFEGPPSVPRVIAHATFLQDVFGHKAFSAGMWTLCIEMQFYAVAILILGLAQRLFRRPAADKPQPSAVALMILFAPAAFISLVYWRPLESTEPWVIHFLWMFFLGMATWWTLDGVLPTFVYAFLVILGTVEMMSNPDWWFQNGVALCTSVAIFAGGRLNRLNVWLTWAPFQYLGRISYSLYLIHFPVSHLLVSVGWDLCGNEPTPIVGTAILLSAVPLSILAAHVLYLLVEAPSARWSASMKRHVESVPTPIESFDLRNG